MCFPFSFLFKVDFSCKKHVGAVAAVGGDGGGGEVGVAARTALYGGDGLRRAGGRELALLYLLCS